MKNKVLFISVILLIAATQINWTHSEKKQNKTQSNPKVTFIELGSVRCIPCKKMEPVLENIRKKYPKDVKVVSHDVWTEKGKPFASKYGIKLIPTQVFLDKTGKEYYRHQGFFPEKEVIKILKTKGVSK